MENLNKNRDNKGEKLLKSLTLAFGLLTTLLTLFIAVSNYSINKRISEYQAKNSEIEAEIKNLTLINSNYENEARIISEIEVFNAKEFAMNYLEQKIDVEWLDTDMRDQFEEYIEKWNKGNNLMKGDSKKGLYLQQVVCLRLTNVSKTTASNLRLKVIQKDFNNVSGFQDVPYFKINKAKFNWVEKQIKLNDLYERNYDHQNIRTQTLIPIVHVAGSNWYFGRVIVPLKISWYDERLSKDNSLDIDVTNDSMIRSKLASAVLGMAK